MDSPFCGKKNTVLEKQSGKFSSQTDHFGDSKMPGCRLGRVFVGVPVICPGRVLLHLIGGFFLLWAVNSHLNKKPNRTAIRFRARCALEEGR